MDACEIFVPNALDIKGMYRDTYISDILDYKYEHYDLHERCPDFKKFHAAADDYWYYVWKKEN